MINGSAISLSGEIRRAALGSISLAVLAVLGATAGHAQALRPDYSPAADNGGGADPDRARIITRTDTTGTITGDYSLRGTSARRFRFDSYTVAERQARGEVVSGYDAIDGRVSVALGAEEKRTVVTYPDQIKGTNVATPVYDNDLLTAFSATDRDTAAFFDTGSPVYGDLRLANISGSDVTIATGSKAKSVYDTANLAIVTADSGSTLYNVAAGSNIVYDAVTATMSGIDQDGLRQRATQDYLVNVTTFSGVTFNGDDSVTDLASLKRYNTSLISRLQSGAITPDQYEGMIQAAAQTSERTVTVRNEPLDRYRAPPTTSERLFIKLDRSTLVTTTDSRLVGMAQADRNTDGGNTLILAQNGSVVTNNGVVTQAGAGPGIRLDGAGTTLVNTATGVIGIGYEVLDRSSGTAVATGSDNRAHTTDNVAILASNGAAIGNAGIINVANRDIASLPNNPEFGKANVGIVVGSGATASNTGTILIGGGASVAANQLGSFDGAAGLVAIGGGTAANAAGGLIRVGTSFAETSADLATVTDIVSINPASGMTSLSGGGALINAGTIRVGVLAQNATGIKIGGDGGTAVNSGAVTLDASPATSPVRRNAAISVLGSGVAGAVNATNTATGVITLGGINSVGLLVENGVAGGSARAVNDGAIVINGGVSSDRLRNYGIYVGNASSSAVQNGAVTMRGEGAIGTHARNGGTVTVGANGTVDFQGARQIGYYALGAGSTITGGSTMTDIDTASSTGLRVEGGAAARGAGLMFTVSGAGAFGIVGSGASSGTTVDAAGVQIAVSGAGATGIVIEGGATGIVDATSDIRLTGANTIAVLVDGQGRDIDGVATGTPVAATSLAAGANLASSAANVTGYVVRNQAQLTHSGMIAFAGANGSAIVGTTGARIANSGTIGLGGGASFGIDLAGTGTTGTHTGRLTGSGTGVRIASGAAFANNGAIALTSGTSILIDGAGSTLSGTGTGAVSVGEGVAALRLVNGGAANTAGSFTGGGTAHGVLVDTGAGALTLGAGTITTTGSGNAIENTAGSTAIRLNGSTLIANGSGAAVHSAVALDPASTATLTAAGANSTGFDFSGTGGARTTGNLALGDGLAITGSGAGSTGVRLNTGGQVTLAGRVAITNAQGGSAIVAGPASSLSNGGTLTSASTAAPVVDLRGGTPVFVNTGTITAASTTATAILGGGNGQAVTLSAGPVTGAVTLGAGNDIFLMTGGTLAGAFDAGAGNDTATFRGLTDANLSGVTAIAGSGTAAGGDTLTFDATISTGTRRITGFNAVNLSNSSTLTADGDLILAGGTMTIGSGSTFFAGNGVRGTVGATTGGTASVVNAGIIDLTNGASGATDTLTIRGNYVGQNGTIRLQTVLAGDGSPSDRLVIDGGAVSGTTMIQITNAGGLGARTTGDGIEVVSAINGGTTTATTTGAGFTLAGEHVDAGAFEYRLYASGLTGTSQSFFLRTQANNQTPVTPVTPADPTFRVEVPLLSTVAGTLRRGDLAMLGTYHQRMGDENGTIARDFTVPGRLWGRVIADDGRVRQGGDARPTTDGRTYGFQIGVDLFRFGTGGGHHDLGVYGGYTEGKFDVSGFAGGIQGRAVGRFDPRSTYAGLYWTYLSDSGFYADTVVQHSWYGGRAVATNGNVAPIDGTGILASVETGYAFPLSPTWVLEPQAQLIAQGNSLDDVVIPNALVQQRDRGQLTGRIGLRTRGRYDTSAGAIQPYLRANLWKAFASTDRTLFITPAATTPVRTSNSALWAEAGAGITWSLSPRLVLYGEADYRRSLDDGQGVVGRSVGGSAGLRISM